VFRAGILLLLVACVLASCGGGGDHTQSPEHVLNTAFSHGMRSADLKLEAEVDLKGLVADPISIEAEGPFRVNEGKLPSADIDLSVGSNGGGQTITSGVLTTGDRAFLKFEDVYYEESPAQVRRANDAIRRQSKGDGRPLGELGLDPRSWLREAKVEGDGKVDGVETRHVSGVLDVERMLSNFNAFLRKSTTALGGGNAVTPLSRADIRQLARSVDDPDFDVYVGKRDDIVRRVSGTIKFKIPEADRAGLGGLQGGSIKFSIELSHVNGHQKIEAPTHARPLSELTRSLGPGGLVGELTGGSSQSSSPSAPGKPGQSGSPEADAFRRYSQCLDKAKPGDTQQLQSCAELLQQP
jgi:hypothetical protein